MAAIKRDYYEVLGVARDADQEAIRRAFHEKARDWNPDVAAFPGAELLFRELAEAYSVLSRTESRLLYDRYGYRGRGNQEFDEALGDARPAVIERGENVHLDLKLRSFEAADGARQVVEYKSRVRCVTCLGLGMLGEPDPDCEFCGGTGRKRSVGNLDAGQLLQVEACPSCVRETCPRCGGIGTVEAEQRIRLLVPPGIEDGTHLRVRGDGNDGGAGSVPGDLVVRVKVLPPPRDARVVRYVALGLLLIAVATLLLYLIR